MTTQVLKHIPLSHLANNTQHCSEDVFGPASCRNDFDFTLLFEQSILSLLPTLSFIIAASLRLWSLRRASIKTLPDPIQTIKLTTALVYAGSQLAVLVFWRTGMELATRVTLTAASFSFLAGLLVAALSFVEHRKSVRPSPVLTAYLLFGSLFQAAQVRTLYLLDAAKGVPASLTASLAIGIIQLMLEVQPKRAYLKQPYKHYSKEATSGIIDWSFLAWLNGLFREGFRKVLTFDDLSPIDEKLKSEPLRIRVLAAWEKRGKPEGRFTLTLVLARCLRWELLTVCIPRLLLIGINFSQPFLITRVIDLLGEPDTPAARNIGYGLIAATFLIFSSRAVLYVQYRQRFAQVLALFRGACVSLIYDQTLRIADGASSGTASVTLMSTDIQTCTDTLPMLNEIWASIIEVIVAIYLLSRQMGPFCVIPIIIYGLSTVVQGKIATGFATHVKNWNGMTQTRVSTTGTALTGMRSARISGIATSIKNLISDARDSEIKASMGYRYVVLLLNVVVALGEHFTPVFTFVAYEVRARIQGSPSLGTSQAFASLSIITLLQEPAAMVLIALPLSASCLGALNRIQDFLLLPTVSSPSIDQPELRERGATSNEAEGIEMLSVTPKVGIQPNAIILMDNVTVRHSPEGPPALSDISCSFTSGSLSMIIGPVGCGKTTFLKAILNEVSFEIGSVRVSSSKFAFATQSAWLPNDNIQSLITGPKTHVAIDEAFYAKVIHACALTEDLAQLPDGDRTIIGSRGITLSGGQRQRIALARAIYARQDIVLLDDTLSALDGNTEQLIVTRLLGDQGLIRKLGSTIILVTHSVRHLALADEVVVLGADGKLLAKGNYRALQSGGYLSEDILQQMQAKKEHKEDSIVPDIVAKVAGPSEEQIEDLTRRVGDATIYKYYAKSVGWRPIALFLGFAAASAFGQSFSQVWLNWYAKADGHRTAFWLTGYAIIHTATLLVRLGYLWACIIQMYGASAKTLHTTLLNAVFGATQAFFTTTDTGVTLNRFSQDLIVVDKDMISGVISSGAGFFQVIAMAGLVFASSTYMAAVLPLLILVLYFLTDVYLKTSRQLRFFDLESKSPLYTHFLETLEGLAVIRAFGWQHEAIQSNIEYLDRSQKPFYLLLSVQRWLEMSLNLMVTALATILMTLALQLRSTSSAGLLAIALINVMSFTDVLSVCIQAFTQLEISLGAIARIRNFARTTVSENKDGEDQTPPASWPDQGAIRFSGLTASYNDTAPPALSSIELTIQPGQKIGICGRTGSGKSTILATLLRLVEISSGTITIDGLDISTIPREVLRARFAAIPQDAFIIAGSVRTNADPTGQSNDATIIAALEKVGLWTIIAARGGLEATLLDQPLSQGQQQLFCLARAMLRGDRSKILILDEATSNVDRDTDRVMQGIIRKEFKDHTILTVAHRLDTIMDSDRIVVLDKALVVEYGAPKELLQGEDGAFRALCGL